MSRQSIDVFRAILSLVLLVWAFALDWRFAVFLIALGVLNVAMEKQDA